MDKPTVNRLIRDLKIDLRDTADYALTNDRTSIRSQIVTMEMKLQQLREATELHVILEDPEILVPEAELDFLGEQIKESTMTKNEKLKAEILADGERRRKAGAHKEVQDYADEDRKRLRIVPLDAGVNNPLYGQ